MAQHDYSIANQGFPATRADINNVLSAIATNNSGTSAPSTQFAGQFWIDTTSSTWTLYIHDGADDIQFATIDTSANTVNFIDSALDVVTDTTPQLGGNLASNGNDIIFADSDKAIFGAGSDLEIFHNGSNSYISDNGTGDLYIRGSSQIRLTNTGASENYAVFNDNGAVSLYHDNSLKFETTATGVTVTGTLTATQFVGGGLNPYRNIIINGDMSIAQRATSVASITTTGYRTVDRWQFGIDSAGSATFTMSQSTDVPSGYGFSTSLKLDNTTANASLGASAQIYLRQLFEGQNLQYLNYANANAKSLTLSFWVKSTKTGTFIAELLRGGRQISKSYTVNTTNTWELKTVTFSGDTAGSVLANNNTGQLSILFFLGNGSNMTSGTLNTSWGTYVDANRAVGQVNIADSTANDFLITGVQLEAGTTASDFEFLPVDVNLGRCFRYYFKTTGFSNTSKNFMNVVVQSGTDSRGQFYRPAVMRASPTFSASGSFQVLGQINQSISSAGDIVLTDGGGVSLNQTSLKATLPLSSTSGHNGILRAAGDANAFFEFISEL
jgi:hypothetical protein